MEEKLQLDEIYIIFEMTTISELKKNRYMVVNLDQIIESPLAAESHV